MGIDFKSVMRYMEMINRFDKYIADIQVIAEIVLHEEEQLISFNLEHSLVYAKEVTGKKEPFADQTNPNNPAYKNTQDTLMIFPPGYPMPPKGEMPEFIKKMIQHNKIGLEEPNSLQTDKFEMDTTITMAVLQTLTNGYLKKRQECLEELNRLGIQFAVTDPLIANNQNQ